MTMLDVPALLLQISRFCADHDMSESGFGRAAVSDPRFVGDLRKGREPRSATVIRVRNFMAEKERAA